LTVKVLLAEVAYTTATILPSGFLKAMAPPPLIPTITTSASTGRSDGVVTL
jgi:hypothetical protein